MTQRRAEPDAAQALSLARGYLRQGKVDLADMVARQALSRVPQDAAAYADALHLLAQVAFARGDTAAAVQHLRHAAEHPAIEPPQRAVYLNDLGAALRQLGEARLEEALEAFRAALRLNPEFADAQLNLGLSLAEAGQAQAALEPLQAALARDAANHAVRNSLARSLLALGRETEAAAEFETLAQQQPDQFEPRYALGGVLQRLQRHAEALAALEQASALNPEHPWAHYHRGVSLGSLDRDVEALDAFLRADTLSPGNPAILNRIAIQLRALGRLDEAEATVRRALALKPDDAHLHNTLGLIALSRRQWGAAEDAFETAGHLRPDMALPIVNLGCMHAMRGAFEASRDSFARALQRAPDDDQLRFSYGIKLLLLGDWAEGWRNYAYRPNVTRLTKHDLLTGPLPRDLTGKRILVDMDQGLGDELLFLRFMRVLKARGAWVAYRPNPKLASFVSRLPEIDLAVGANAVPDDLDYRLAVGDLALAVDMRAADEIPPPVCLAPSAGAKRQARALLEPLGPGPFIGVTWRGGTSKEEFSKWNVLFKEIPLKDLAGTLREALRGRPGTVLALQRKPKAGEIEAFAEALGRPVHDLTALNERLEVMLALLSEIEEYVAVSNTNVHLRAGGGRDSRVLIPHPPDWRWMCEGFSPWYPTIPTYRQEKISAEEERSWQPALDKLHEDLRATISGDNR